MAAQRREAKRQAREQARLAKELEKARQQRHIDSQQRAAELKTAEVEKQVKTLDEVLTSILPLPGLTFDSLKATPELPHFDPGSLGTAEPAPDWDDYEPPEPGGLSRLFGGAARYERQTAEARARFDAAMTEYRQREGQRQDGGVDAVATNKNLFFGGVCLIQAKRWTGVVGLESVHALTGVMADHNATTGVLVTTSWFGRASEQFANRNRITLVNGAELKQLIREHLKMDVIPGTTPPRRLRASDNTQTGRPGPVAPGSADHGHG